MATRDNESSLELSRRRLLAAAGVGGGTLLAASIIGIGEGETAPASPSPEDVATTPVAGLHLQFGADASSEMMVSWHTLQAVRHPRVMLGRLDGTLEQTVTATETSYTDAKSGQVVYAYHAKLDRPRAQQRDGVRRIAVLMDTEETNTDGQARIAAFRQGLQQLGWTEDHNIRIDLRWGGGDVERTRAYAAELVGLKPDVIFAYAVAQLAPLSRETHEIPIVFCGAWAPVADGFVAS